MPWPDADLRAQWSRILEQPDHPRHEQVIGVLKDFMTALTGQWRDPDKKLADRLRWTLFFRDSYRKVVQMAEDQQ